ncbi:MATE family efflux transporter [Phocicoccus pinnipedialis]|uniref:Multidrug export protein MepA n=1 Tax=Phocicoccus pinnipedialis TaxID=110845 RepID=A0A6V7RMP7_9BACL|nr:MATE family efflux transporter [Jeotgalicoccus pinnipedialis]MBP1940232.1 putative MATE family efflux protein [Jeotgalicoccus pinnipedialis]CAD2079583.1 Multidrug export protein MepA [Jeotgalicoccus pinnipedialis]
MNNHPVLNRLDTESVGKSFVRYLIPSIVGMMLMAVNIVIDGIMVGNRLGSVALAGVGIAVPVYTIFVATSLWIGIGAATKYSIEMGAKRTEEARIVFSNAITSIFIVTLIIAIVAYINQIKLAYALGANSDTYVYVADYMSIMLIFGFIFTIENVFSVMVRNDGGPNLSMVALVITSLVNIALNYIFLFKLDYGVKGAAAATVIGAAIGIVILSMHFFKKESNLRFVRFKFDYKLLATLLVIGFPSFLSEVGFSVFTISHNVTFKYLAGTDGVSAFAVLNYVHSVMLLLFLGMGGAIQPLISYYYGAKDNHKMTVTLRLAIWTSLGAGILFFFIGLNASGPMVDLFGNFPSEVRAIAIPGIKLFFIAYLFMGINFVMMTYYQSIGQIRMAIWITSAREIILLLIILAILPRIFGLNGVWLAIPLSEFIVLITIIYYQKARD